MPTKDELEAKVIVLNKMFESELDRANEWQVVAEHRAKTIKELQAKLTDSIKKCTNLKKKYRNTVKNRAMFKWFTEYLQDGNDKENVYFYIYIKAVEAGFMEKVEHKDHKNSNTVEWKKSIEDKIRKRLKAHCKHKNIPYPE